MNLENMKNAFQIIAIASYFIILILGQFQLKGWGGIMRYCVGLVLFQILNEADFDYFLDIILESNPQD